MTQTKKTLLFIDMDNVMVDFKSGLAKVSEEIKQQYECDEKGKPHYDDIPGIFALNGAYALITGQSSSEIIGSKWVPTVSPIGRVLSCI